MRSSNAKRKRWPSALSPGKFCFREGLADDGDARRRERVGLGEAAAGEQRNANCGEVSRRREAETRDPGVDRVLGLAFLADRPDAAAHRHRHEADEAGVHDSGQSARVGQDPIVEGLPGRGRLVFRKGQRSPERHDAFRAESGIDALQLPERPYEESRGGEKRHRRGHFGDHEERAKPLGRPARAGAGPFGERLGPGVAAGPQRRKHAERDSGHRRQGRGKEEDPRIDRRSAHQRDGFGQKPREQRRGRRRENDAERAAGKGQQQALRQELAQQPLPPGPERRAHGELLAPGDGAHEKETRQVRACDQEHGERRAEQGRDEEARLVPEPVAQGDDRRAVLRVVLRVCALERRGDSAHLPAAPPRARRRASVARRDGASSSPDPRSSPR